MLALPTTTITILRGNEDDYDGSISNETTVATGVSASILEQARNVGGFTGGERRTVRLITCRVSAGVDLRDDDDVVDERTGTRYAAQNVRLMQNPVVQMDLTAELKRTGSNTQ